MTPIAPIADGKPVAFPFGKAAGKVLYIDESASAQQARRDRRTRAPLAGDHDRQIAPQLSSRVVQIAEEEMPGSRDVPFAPFGIATDVDQLQLGWIARRKRLCVDRWYLLQAAAGTVPPFEDRASSPRRHAIVPDHGELPRQCRRVLATRVLLLDEQHDVAVVVKQRARPGREQLARRYVQRSWNEPGRERRRWSGIDDLSVTRDRVRVGARNQRLE